MPVRRVRREQPNYARYSVMMLLRRTSTRSTRTSKSGTCDRIMHRRISKRIRRVPSKEGQYKLSSRGLRHTTHQVSFLLRHFPCACPPMISSDTKYNKTFLMTYKSFTTTNELFDLLVARFWTQPPEGITPAELDEWKRLKQHVVRARLVLLLSPLICTKRWHQSSEHLQVDDRRQRHSRGRRLLHP